MWIEFRKRKMEFSATVLIILVLTMIGNIKMSKEVKSHGKSGCTSPGGSRKNNSVTQNHSHTVDTDQQMTKSPTTNNETEDQGAASVPPSFWIGYPLYINISGDSQFNITIEENITDLKCNWNEVSCYIECTSANLSLNISDRLDSWTIKSEANNLILNLNSSGQFLSVCNVTKCTANAVSHLMNEISNQNSDATKLKRLLNVKNACLPLWIQPNVVRTYFIAEKYSIDTIIRIPFEGKSKGYDLADIVITVVKMDMSTGNNRYIQISAPKVFGYDTPVQIMVPTEPFLDASGDQAVVAVVSYSAPAGQMFLDTQSNVSLMSNVIRVEVVGRDINDLSDLLVINFTMNNSTAVSANQRLSCQFYDDKDQLSQPYQWKDYGSYTTLNYVNSSNIVMCSYNHMTPFAVLLGDLKIDGQNWIILSYLSYVGCGISLFFCAVSVFVYIVKRNPNVTYSSSIHVSLSGALLLLNASYLFSEWTASLGAEGVCVFVAVAMEYSLLCCFFWMAIEAIHLYLLLVKVFNTYIRHYMAKLSLIGWGVPAVLVGVSLSVYDILPLYGTKSITLSDTQTESKFCWIINNSFLYGMNITCLSLMFLLNNTILTTVICQIIKLQQWGTKHRMSSAKNICCMLGLTCLLGMTWGLAFFSFGYTNYPVLYLFCICNSLQGFFMFLWIWSSTRSTQNHEANKLTPFKACSTISTPNKSSFPDITAHS